MKRERNSKRNRLAIIAGAAALVLLLVAGALYGQGGPGGQGGQGGQGWGQGGGRPGGWGQGQGQGGPGMQHPGMAGGGPGGMEMMMQDPEIRALMNEIRTVSQINKLGLNRDQVQDIAGLFQADPGNHQSTGKRNPRPG